MIYLNRIMILNKDKNLSHHSKKFHKNQFMILVLLMDQFLLYLIKKMKIYLKNKIWNCK